MSATGDAIKTCGSCEFGKRVELGVIECRGLPPTPQAITSGTDALGRPAMQVTLLRARLPTTEPACALYKFKIQLDLGGLKQ